MHNLPSWIQYVIMNAQLAIMHTQYAVMHAQLAIMHAQYAVMHAQLVLHQLRVCTTCYLPYATCTTAACITLC